jgi:hypothetical protein
MGVNVNFARLRSGRNRPQQPAIPQPLRGVVTAAGRNLGYTPHRVASPGFLPLDVSSRGLSPNALLEAYNANPLAAATPPEGEIVRTEVAKGTTDAPIAIVVVGQDTTFYVQKPGVEAGVQQRVACAAGARCQPVAYNAGGGVYPGRYLARRYEPRTRRCRSRCDVHTFG